jgi:hypothetical protein
LQPDLRYNKPINYEEEYNLDDIISIDESSISNGLHPNKGREIIGK